MRRHLALAIATTVVVTSTASKAESGWIFKPSTYSHDPATGRRVAQYAPKQRAYANLDPTYLASGYRHTRMTLRGADGSADRVHIVQTWGAGEAIRPYGEWLFPFRPGATPYGPWGNPQGPWTLPFDSWRNPYGLGRLPHPPWPHWPSTSLYPPLRPPPGHSPQGPSGPAPTLPPQAPPAQ